MTRARARGDRTWLFRIASVIVLPLFALVTRIRIQGLERLPRTGPAIFVANHITEIDPVILGIVVYRAHRSPRFLAKGSLFRVPVLGGILRALGQIPVERTATGGGSALASAEDMLRAGGSVIVYPEGTLTRDPDLWPMVGRSGAVRLAWATGAPVIPIAHWGTQNLLGRYEKRPHLVPPRKRIQVRVGEAVTLPASAEAEHDARLLEHATDQVMWAITAELEQIRGPKPDGRLWADRTVPARALTPRGIEKEE